MKKNFFVLLVLSFLFVSCANMFNDPRNQWDKDRIAYLNNSDLKLVQTKTDTYHNTNGFGRLDGTTGIIGRFTSYIIDTSRRSSYCQQETYIFKDNGEYEWTENITSGATTLKNFKAKGKYVLYKYTDNYYIVEIGSYGEEFFFVSDDALSFSSSVIIDGQTISANKVVRKIQGLD